MTALDIREWSYPTRIIFGCGAVQRLPELCKSLAMSAPLFVTDEGLREAPIVTGTLDLLRAGGVATKCFSDVVGNPTAANVEAGLAAFQRGGHDGVIAFGGGSGLDAAKAIAFMSGQDLDIWAFEEVGDNWKRGKTDKLPPVIALPTTAGTGSEVGRASVISNEETKEKKIIFHPSMMPEIALCDPELTRGLPPHLTAATGFDAFVHCFEAFCAPGFHPMADGMALEGMRRIAAYLPRAVETGDDLEARANMMVAASMGATAFQKGLGGVHSISHAVGALYGTHHGLTNAVVMPYVVAANRSAIEDDMKLVARLLDLPNPGFDAVFAWLLDFRHRIGIPHSLAELKVPSDRAEEIGARAIQDPTAAGNPIPHSAETYAQIFRRACRGEI
ncbi:1,3-propanediol dehydrogenase [bacterium MnTg02]|nr:1,3-propanediol dehydrogenase [bacterium MnTg02]